MILVWLLTAVLVVDCLFLVLLVLVQLPKKEAGAGMAFGGAATDALFGAGSGNALTKITKYAAATFFVVTLLLSVLSGQMNKGRVSAVEEILKSDAGQAAPAAAPGASQLTPPPTGAAPSTPGAAPVITPTPQAAPATTPPPAAAPETQPAEPK